MCLYSCVTVPNLAQGSVVLLIAHPYPNSIIRTNYALEMNFADGPFGVFVNSVFDFFNVP